MTENPIRDTPWWVGLWDTRDYSEVRHICFKIKTTFESLYIKNRLSMVLKKTWASF